MARPPCSAEHDNLGAVHADIVRRPLQGEGEARQQLHQVADGAVVEALARATLDRFGAIDALVNVAALDTLFGGVFDTDIDGWRKTFEVNVYGLATLVKAIAGEMKTHGGGSIVLIGSQSSELPGPPQPVVSGPMTSGRVAGSG